MRPLHLGGTGRGGGPDGDTRWPSCTFYDLALADDAGAFWAVGYCPTPWTRAATRTHTV
ncbi:hypothetical protein H4K38_04675 [Streptomyces sp. I3(2020)]|nr:hypothetical protein [Streptomyces sp. I3(2020)]